MENEDQAPLTIKRKDNSTIVEPTTIQEPAIKVKKPRKPKTAKQLESFMSKTRNVLTTNRKERHMDKLVKASQILVDNEKRLAEQQQQKPKQQSSSSTVSSSSPEIVIIKKQRPVKKHKKKVKYVYADSSESESESESEEEPIKAFGKSKQHKKSKPPVVEAKQKPQIKTIQSYKNYFAD